MIDDFGLAIALGAVLAFASSTAGQYPTPSTIIANSQAEEGKTISVIGWLFVPTSGRMALWTSEQSAMEGIWDEACLSIYAPGELKDYRKFSKKMVVVRGAFYNDLPRGGIDFHLCNSKGLDVTFKKDISIYRKGGK